MKKRYTLEQKRWDDPAEHAMPEHSRVPASFTIGNVKIAPATVLAPMAGVTDTVFRRFIKNASQFTTPADGLADSSADVDSVTSNQQSGCGLIMTEFTSADGLSRMRETKRKRYLTYYDDEHPISAQLFGSNPATLADSARIVQDAGFDLVDLNLGCPAKRVVACNGGSGLLRDLPLIETIFKTVRAAVSIPFTVKFRMGWNDKHIVCVELAKMAEDCGLNAVALHARTREDGYTGQARWEYIAAVKDAVKIPVIGNGDIRTPEDAAAMVDVTGCDAVMIGRTAPSNPWIFRQIAQYTATKEATGVGTYDQPTDQDRYRMIRTYFQMLVDEIAIEERAEAARAEAITAAGQVAREQRHRDCVGKMKQFASWFTHGVPGGGALRKQIFESKNGDAVLGAIESFFANRVDGLISHPELLTQDDQLLTSAAYCD
ncbi:tRNA dihydrouridine synthase DusB [Tunturiibacter gelidoferens]|uniref:NifR3 family TIM-barrel protein n=1 Tax=Tunturiibacter gelidiferens TaxID=3069689 RepID=A0A9X0QEN6_9BACT|nr:tRNA dihydrouridine synthase DusB [Edaphobacter lichenicola]MBB5328953.1 nifR3 family TIM-barrel protein [Edaphobacter lichenicola]